SAQAAGEESNLHAAENKRWPQPLRDSDEARREQALMEAELRSLRILDELLRREEVDDERREATLVESLGHICVGVVVEMIAVTVGDDNQPTGVLDQIEPSVDRRWTHRDQYFNACELGKCGRGHGASFSNHPR